MRRGLRRSIEVTFATVAAAVLVAQSGYAKTSLEEGITALRAGRPEVASRVLAQYVEAFPNDPTGLLWLGASYYYQKRYPEAAWAFYRASTIQPSAYGYLWLGATYTNMGRTEDATKLLTWVAKHSSDRQVLYIARLWLRATLPLAALPSSPIPTAYAKVVRMYNPNLSPLLVDLVVRSILYYSAHYRVDPRLVMALIAVESGFQVHARSPAGAYGLGQLMPATWQALGVNPADPVSNIYGTVRTLRAHFDRYGPENLHLVLAAYNAGRGAVEKFGGVPPFAETQWYVLNVQTLYRRFLGGSPQVAPRAPIDM